jgi:hypothetical protein
MNIKTYFILFFIMTYVGNLDTCLEATLVYFTVVEVGTLSDKR